MRGMSAESVPHAYGVNTPYLWQGVLANSPIMQTEKTERSGELQDSVDGSVQRPAFPLARILTVADDPCRLNAEALRRHGYEVDIACGSKAGWEMLQNIPYNLLVTEHDLTGLTGVGLLKKLRSACMSLPVIIAIETLPPWQSAEYPWLLKATKLFKPYTFVELLDLVRRVFPATNRIHAEMVTSSTWQDRPSADCLPLGATLSTSLPINVLTRSIMS